MEEHSSTQSSGISYKQAFKTATRKPLFGAIVLVFVVAVATSFYGGTLYQKSQQPRAITRNTNNLSRGGGFGGARFTRNRFIGSVTAISATDISIDNTRDGTSMTFTINANTQITDSGQTVTAGDIQTGENVIVTENPSNSGVATRIIVNPNLNGFSSTSPYMMNTPPGATIN